MDLNGMMRLAVTPDVAMAGFDDPHVLGLMLPVGSDLTRSGPDSFDFRVVKDAGVMTLRLPGTVTMTRLAAGYGLSAQARHQLGGRATLRLQLTFAPDGPGSRLTYSGRLEATGLAARLLADRADQVQEMVQARLGAIRDVLETRGLRAGA